MVSTLASKCCEQCGTRYYRAAYGVANARWAQRRFCSPKCSRAHGLAEQPDEILIENAEWVLDPTAPRLPIDIILGQLGYSTPESLAKRLHRIGRDDLVEWLNRRTEKAAA